jgi:hypothetical protein
MLREFSGVEPVVAGKPERPLLDETIRRVGGRRPLMVGDRLDTDIDGAVNAECDSLLVMTGVTGVDELVGVPAGRRPTYIAADLGGLLLANPAPTSADARAELGGWCAQVEHGRLRVEGDGEAHDWWRVVAAAAWSFLDETGQPVDTVALEPPSIRSPAAGR